MALRDLIRNKRFDRPASETTATVATNKSCNEETVAKIAVAQGAVWMSFLSHHWA